ncbi:hypothetical protein [Mesorhizobium jarvisii]|uniref:hypothetical protein n=1 Tax=Mesorhizobium jarvisii TaxID=1777867 RepID=UPI001F0AD68E|nr:hypothetical protein [Mesorhizobium jarvisii]MCH4561510.1 hypothetical protein [Mesorhizobium jarvisii]
MSELAPVLSLELEAVPANGPSISFKLEVQRPFLEREMQWRCVVTMGNFQRPIRIAGGDPLQALCLAIDFTRWTLRTFEEGGGKLMCEGDRFPLDAYFFKPPE